MRSCVHWRTQFFKIVGFAGKRLLRSPPPPPPPSFFFFFCSRSNFLDEPREETLATQASKLSIGGSREKSRESSTRKETPVRGVGKEKDSLRRSLIHFHFHPREHRKQQSMKTVTLAFQEQNIIILHKEKTTKRK